MYYGGSRKDPASATKPGADGGIDGVIKEDPLGLDKIYVQAKRWQTAVGAPAESEFAGSLDGHNAKKGILITAATFSQQALKYVQNIEKTIALIDGKELATLMIRHNVGVRETSTYKVAEVDLDKHTDL